MEVRQLTAQPGNFSTASQTTRDDNPIPVPTPRSSKPDQQASMHDMLRMMDVASALRRQRESAEDQLDLTSQKRDLRERLLATATASGEALTPAEVDAAIEQYYEQKHRYEDPPRGWARFWATAWIDRWRWLLALLLLAAALLGAFALAHSLSGGTPTSQPQAPAPAADSEQEPSTRPSKRPSYPKPPAKPARTPHELLQEAIASARALAADADAKRRVAALAASASAAEAGGDDAAATALLARLTKLTSRLEEEYVVRIVVAQNERSGVFREYRGKVSGHYLIVEAVDPAGRILPRSIESSETGRTSRVRRWGERVPESIYNQVADDKRDNGLIDQRIVARKLPGQFAEQIVFEDRSGNKLTRSGAITQW